MFNHVSLKLTQSQAAFIKTLPVHGLRQKLNGDLPQIVELDYYKCFEYWLGSELVFRFQIVKMSTSSLKVTFLGLGSMGSAIATNILKKGFQLVVWSRTTSKANVNQLKNERKLTMNILIHQDLVKAGARSAATALEAVADADVIVSCLFDDKSCIDTAQGCNSSSQNLL